MVVIALATLSVSVIACSQDYGPEIQRLSEQNAQIQEDTVTNKTRLDQLEKANQEIAALADRIAELEQDNREAAILIERIEKIEQDSEEIPVLSHRILLLEEANEEDGDSSGSGIILRYEDATDEERAIVRKAAECTSKLIGENINPILVDEIEKEIWKDLESGGWESFAELRLSLSIICADQ